MQRSIAFLRAINVGGHAVKMEALRTLFEALGFANVATFIASGNVIFESRAADARRLEQRIERHLQQSLGYEVATFIRSPSELAEVVAYQRFPMVDPATIGASLYIAFLKAAPTREAGQKLLAYRTEMDDFHIHAREVYWLCRTRSSESAFSGALLEKTIGLPATMRNITTVRKLAAAYASPQ
ncbi:MAG: DUF1697 domain-containing protein [Chloroflexi bacterium]|nr:DUF1697 domain-containing protein [Chloroflexota bacterium]